MWSWESAVDHADARELLEIAATEPHGWDRLMAGDTSEAAALAGHLAGCAACADEMDRLRRASIVIRDVVRSAPSPELRERTLTRVAAVGRPRGTPAAVSSSAPVGSTPSPANAPVAPELAGLGLAAPRPMPRRAGWLAAAAMVVLAVVGTGLVVAGQRDAELATRTAALEERARDVAALERITTASLGLAAEPGARQVTLSGSPGSADRGSLLFSPASGQLVVVASGLTEPEAGREFRCWVEVAGERQPVGRMYFADDLAFWVGEVAEVRGLSGDATFGVTLVDTGGPVLDGAPILSGEL